jgi:hypothetical protein
MAMAITQAPILALACIPGITGKGHGGEAVLVFLTIVIGMGVQTNIY